MHDAGPTLDGLICGKEVVVGVQPDTSSPLRALLVQSNYWRWSVATQMTRLSPLMMSLGFVLAGAYATGTYAAGGLMVTAYEIAQVGASRVAGRLLDRLGPAIGAPRLLGLAGIALAGLAAAVAFKAPAPLLVLLAGVAGALPAGISGGMRSLLSDTVTPRLLAPALAIDATIIDVVVVTAPLLVLAVDVVAGPPGVLVAMVGATVVAAFLVRGLRDAVTGPSNANVPSVRGRWSVSSNPRFVFWLLVSLAFGQALGTAETCALPVAARLGGGTVQAVGLVAALALTSALAGILYAAFAHRLAAGAFLRACALLGLLIAGSIGLGLATDWVTTVAAMIALGLGAAPLNTVRSQAAEAEVPPACKTEAFSVLFATQIIGFALGGLFLAILPLKATLIAGGASGIAALILSPLLLHRHYH